MVHGIPGCGKTTLCSAVIDAHEEHAKANPSVAPLAYFYCNASESDIERHSAAGVLRSLARQLTVLGSLQPSIHCKTLALYDRLAEKAKADTFAIVKPSISQCLSLILAAFEDNPATIVIDALDELDDPSELVKALNEIVQRAENVVKVLITCRSNPTMLAMMPTSRTIQVTQELNLADVRLFATELVRKSISDGKLLRGAVKQSLEIIIVDALVAGAGEMLLWAKLQLRHLCEKGHEDDVLSSLNTLADTTLDDLYHATYQRILQSGGLSAEIAKQAFCWLLHAQEELTATAFLEIIGSAPTTTENVVSICRGFVQWDSRTNVFSFVHHSVRQFLQQQWTFEPARAQDLVASRCLQILQNPPAHDLTTLSPALASYDYAVLYSGYHCAAVRHLDHSNSLSDNVREFLVDDNQISLPAQIWIENVRDSYSSLPRDHSQKAVMEMLSTKALHLSFPMCIFGFVDVFEQHNWPTDYDWDMRNDHEQTVLYVASYFGYEKVAAFLLQRDANPNIVCGRLGSALHCAAFRGHTNIVKILLDHNAALEICSLFDSAIQAACKGDKESAALTILENTAVATQDSFDQRLEAVSEAGFFQATEYLLDHPFGDTTDRAQALKTGDKVVMSGNVNILRRLLRKADLANTVPEDSVALSALHGHQEMTAFLTDQGMSIEHPGRLGRPLRCAALNGHADVCRLLLDRGAAVDGKDHFGNALHAAAMKGKIDAVEMLLEFGANVNESGGTFGTPLQAAAYSGHKDIVSLLLTRKANPTLAGYSKDVFHAAAEGGQYEIINLLLSMGLKPSSPLPPPVADFMEYVRPARDMIRQASPDGRVRSNPHSRYQSLDRADSPDSREDNRAHENIEFTGGMRVPTDYWSSREGLGHRGSRDDQNTYMLEAAASLGHINTVSTILSRHDSLYTDDSAIENALLAACRAGQGAVVKTLLAWNEDVDQLPRRALQEAASHGQVSVVRILSEELVVSKGPSDVLLDVLRCSIEGPPTAFQETLDAIRAFAPTVDTYHLMENCLARATRCDRGDITRFILEHCPTIPMSRLLANLDYACRAGKAIVAREFYEALQLGERSSGRLSIYFRLAIQKIHDDVAMLLLPNFLLWATKQQLRAAFLASAGNGLVDLVHSLLEAYAQRYPIDYTILQQGLNIAAENGHSEVCQLLIAKGADPSESAYTIVWKDVYVKDEMKPTLFCYYEGGRLSNEAVLDCPEVEEGDEPAMTEAQLRDAFLDDDLGVKQLLANTELFLPTENSSSGTRFMTAFEACLSGCEWVEENELSRIMQQTWRHSPWATGDESERDLTMQTFLSSVSTAARPFQNAVFCRAAAICPPEIFELTLVKGKYSPAKHGTETVLEAAVGRECYSFTMLQTLVQFGALENTGEQTLKRLLDKALAFFQTGQEDRTRRTELFPRSKSLEDVLTTGPGAVAFELLRKLPNQQADTEEFAVLLQHAVVAGQTDHIRLLISRNVNVNTAVSYYGTSLQAAARSGNLVVMQILLEAGSDPNIVHGRYRTALRAAVVAGSKECVALLLAHGADTEVTGRAENAPSIIGSEEEFSDTDLELDDADDQWTETDHDRIDIDLDVISDDLKWEHDPDSTALHLAVDRENVDISLALVKSGADVNAKGMFAQSLLTKACILGDSGLIQAIITADPNLADRTCDRSCSGTVGTVDTGEYGLRRFIEFESPLHAAIRRRRLDVLELLLAHGLDPRARKGYLKSCLALAAAVGDVNIVKWLLSLKRPRSTDTFHIPAKAAAQNARLEALKELASQGAIFYDSASRLELLKAVCMCSDGRVVEFVLESLSQNDQLEDAWTEFLEKGIRANALLYESIVDYLPCTTEMLVEACVLDYDSIVKIALEQGLDPNVTDSKGRPALHTAAAHGSARCVELLLNNHANPGMHDPTYGKPLMVTLEGCSASHLLGQSLPDTATEYVKLLMTPEQISRSSYTRSERLSYLKAQQYENIVKSLLAFDVSAELPASQFGSPLTMASFMGLSHVFEVLIAHGAKIDGIGGQLYSPLVAAIKGNHSKLARRILSLGCIDRTQALNAACEMGNLSMVKMFLDDEPDFTVRDIRGRTALQICLENLTAADKGRFFHYNNTKPVHWTILNTVLQSDKTRAIQDSELIEAAKLQGEKARTRILDALLARSQSQYFPDEAFIHLLKHDHFGADPGEETGLFVRLLAEKKIEHITDKMIAAADRVQTVKRLLDYDPSYQITATTLANAKYPQSHLVRKLLLELAPASAKENDV